MAELKRPMDGLERLLESLPAPPLGVSGDGDTFSSGKKNSLRSDTFFPAEKASPSPRPNFGAVVL